VSKKQYARLKVMLQIGDLATEEIAVIKVEVYKARNMIRRLSQRAILNGALSN
jgi:hypothetical protein